MRLGKRILGLSVMALSIHLAAVGPVFAESKQPFFGLQIQGISDNIAHALGLDNVNGVMVRDIAYPGPASHSEISRGDIILELNGQAANSVEKVVEIVRAFKPGDAIKAKLLRRDKEVEVSIPIGPIPPNWDVKRNNFATIPALGLTFAAITKKVQERFDLEWGARGVVISLLDEEKSKGLDLNVGDVVIQVNQRPVWKPGHVVSYIKKAQTENKDFVLLLIDGRNGFRFAMLPVPK